jgi:hypothetical protein
MRTLGALSMLLLALGLWSYPAVAGENPDGKPLPGVSQQINDTQLDQCRGGAGDPADYAQVSRTVPTTQKVVDDTVNFSQDVVSTMKGYNTNPPSNPAIGPSGSQIGPNQNVGPTWGRGQDLTIRNR